MIENDPAVKSYTVTTVPVTLKTPQFWKDADILVYDIDNSSVATRLVLDTNYTLSGAGAADGGSLALTSRANTGTSTIVVFCDPGRDQSVDYIRNDDFPADTHEVALDKLTRMVQVLREQTARSLRIPIYEELLDPSVLGTELLLADRSDKILRFNSSGVLETVTAETALFYDGAISLNYTDFSTPAAEGGLYLGLDSSSDYGFLIGTDTSYLQYDGSVGNLNLVGGTLTGGAISGGSITIGSAANEFFVDSSNMRYGGADGLVVNTSDYFGTDTVYLQLGGAFDAGDGSTTNGGMSLYASPTQGIDLLFGHPGDGQQIRLQTNPLYDSSELKFRAADNDVYISLYAGRTGAPFSTNPLASGLYIDGTGGPYPVLFEMNGISPAIQLNSTQILTTQQPAIADLNQTITGPSIAEVQAISDKVDALMAMLRVHGLMAS